MKQHDDEAYAGLHLTNILMISKLVSPCAKGNGIVAIVQCTH